MRTLRRKQAKKNTQQMIKHYLTHVENAVKNHWDSPAITNYGKNTFTFGQVAETIEKLHILLE